MTTARAWTVRLVLLFIAVLYTFIGYLFVSDPIGTSDGFKTALDSPTAITTIRVTYGMGFLSLALTAWFGLARPRYAFDAVTLLLAMVAAVVAFRLYGLAVDGVSDRNLEELRDESTGLALLVVAWIAYPSKTRPAVAASSNPGAMLWIYRIAFALVAAAFGYEGLKTGFDPESISRLGWQLNEEVAATTVRAGLGGHWLAVAAITVVGFLKPNWRLSCFAFAAMWTVMIFIGRAGGAAVDGLDATQLSQLIQEGVAATVATVGFLAARRSMSAAG